MPVITRALKKSFKKQLLIKGAEIEKILLLFFHLVCAIKPSTDVSSTRKIAIE